MCQRFSVGERKIIINNQNTIVEKPLKKDLTYYRSLSARDVLKTRKSLVIEDFFQENCPDTQKETLNLNKNFTDEELKIALDHLKKICS